MLLRNLLPRFIVLCTFGVSCLSASLIFNVNAGSLTTSVYTDNTTGQSQFDVRGAILTSVSDGTANLGPVYIADTTGGTDPGFSALPFGNSLLLAEDSGTSSNGQFDSLMFDFSMPMVSGNVLTLDATAVPLPIGTTPDALLGSLISQGPLMFSFTFSNQQVIGNSGTLSTFVLTGINSTATAVPEPASASLWVTGLLLFAVPAFIRRRDRRSESNARAVEGLS